MVKTIRGLLLALMLMAGEASAQFCPGLPPWVFDDVPITHPFCTDITWMAQRGVTLGCALIDPNHRLYCPDANVDRSQMAALMHRLGDALLPLTCAPGQVMKWDGLQWACANDAIGGGVGTVTNLSPGTGITLVPNPITATGSIAVNTATIQARVTGVCALGNSIRMINSDGTVSCEADDVGGAGTVTNLTPGAGITFTPNPITVTGSIAADTTYLQRRISASCVAGSSIRAIAADGAVTCQVDSFGPTNAFVQNGNSFGTAGILGTTDSFPLELRANGARVALYEPNAISPNIVLGSPHNVAWFGVRGATISGGGVQSGSVDPDFEVEAPNIVTDAYGTVGGGYGNRSGDGAGTEIDRAFATVGGGQANTASGYSSTVAGGQVNVASGRESTVGGGISNVASNQAATIGGGSFNAATNVLATVSGGYHNTASGDRAIVGGGDSNNAIGEFSVVGGGILNTALGGVSVVGGGTVNVASGTYAVVGGGASNAASGLNSTIAGGLGNIASGAWSAISGGSNNTASGERSFVGAGIYNGASGTYASIGGGYLNIASGIAAVVAGGDANSASGYYSMVVGGAGNVASGTYSFAAGRRAKSESTDAIPIAHHGAFVWADSIPRDFNSSSDNEFAVRAIGGVRFVTAVDGAGMPTWTCGVSGGSGGSWGCSSDRSLKTDVVQMDPEATLASLAKLPVYRWVARDDPRRTPHAGPTSQDFMAAFGLGDNDTMIGFADAQGVALAAIQGLHQLVRERDAKLEALSREVADLRRTVEALIQHSPR